MITYTLTLRGEQYHVQLKGRRNGSLLLSVNGCDYIVPCDPLLRPHASEVSIERSTQMRAASDQSHSTLPFCAQIKAPLPGIISEIKAQVGNTIEAGSTVVVIEAMKMENPIRATNKARVVDVHVSKGQEIAQGALLVSLEQCE